MLRRFVPLAVLAVVTGGFRPPPALADGDPAAVSFEKDVLPVLKANCYKCHDAAKKRAGLRLDVRSAAVKGGESGKPGVVAGKAAASELYRRVSSADEDQVMPPKKPLPAAQVAALKAWIDAGAKWPDALANEPAAKHWAFETPTRPGVPGTRYPVRNPIDAFARARLEKEGLAPAPEADKVTLCRRLYLDLIGLPPTPKEVDEFVADTSPDAYEKLVEKLLASPHYGERWGRLWLDAARYADSDGFEKDKPRFVWFYRDWVVSAFNRDLPYDRFVTEQLAGDLLPNATQEQVVATGYLRNSMINEEGGVDPEQFRMEAMFDRMDAIGKGILGLTIQCAQCHSHKFDPITQTDYYRLFAYLNNSHEANVTVYTPDEQMRRAGVLRRIREAEADLRHKAPDWRKRMAWWEGFARMGQPAWTVMRPAIPDETTGGAKYLPQPDGSFLQQSYAPTKHSVRLEWTTDLKDVTAFRLELLNDPNLPRGGPGRSIEGTAALTEFEAWYAPADGSGKMTKVKFKAATSDAEIPEAPLKDIYADKSNRKRVIGPAAFAIDGKDETAWGHDTDPGRRNLPRKAVFLAEKPIPGFPGGTMLHVYLKQNHGGWNSDDNQNCNLGRFRVSVTTAPGAAADPLPAKVREIISTVPAEKRTPAQADAVFSYWRTTVPGWKDANAKIEALWKQHPEGATQLALKERQRGRPTHVLKRGDFLKPGEPVAPGVPGFLHPADPGLPPNRLGLAKWLTDERSPTTARAYVNRVWQAYFGTGIVATSEDFGTQCEPPSHPELLDWLAVEFMEPTKPTDGRPWAFPAPAWSVKRLHKLIVTSATYRQSSTVSPELAAKDPYNRLLARGPRFRVDAEVVRDAALAASGLLNPKVGGPSVYPPIPGFLMLPPASYGPKVWKEDAGADRYRRSLYVFRFRSVPYPPLQAFDAPTGDFACVRRTRSNTPLMALTAMNEPVFVEAARGLGRRALVEGGRTDADRLTYAFRLCVARKPTAAEATVLAGLLAKEKAKYADPAADAWGVAVGKPEEYRALPNTATPAELAAWVAVGRVLLNLDETMTKE